jgi:hypothetical protein
MALNQSALSLNVKLNLSNTRISTTPTQPVTLKSQQKTISTINELTDVVETTPESGQTLVYDATIDKYIVKKLTTSDLDLTSLDGGTF